jgi:predicted kinase
MGFSKAIFKKVNGVLCLLCNECGEVIKTAKNFGPMEKAAVQGVITMGADYCDNHQHMAQTYSTKRYVETVKEKIKNKLREGIVRKNVLNIDITRPNQKLDIMRGIPGSGKSTKAKSLVGEGIIHSTDTLIEATGDYRGYFKKMVDSGDWSEHGRMHNRNFLNAKGSMLEGVSPVVIDNTNIKASEPKKYVEAALKMGFDEANIRIVDVADGGVSAEVLVERNSHGVGMKTIKRMTDSHRGVGKLTVSKILEAKDKKRKVLYNGVVIDDASKNKLLSTLMEMKMIPEGWKTFAHHMTISVGKPLENRGVIGNTVNLTATDVGSNDKAIAVKVTGYPTVNDVPHITIAVNVAEGGMPSNSKEITDWSPLGSPISLQGVVEEVTGK